MQATFWALIPPLLAIVISLITKEVNLSLFAGILMGALLFTGGNLLKALETILSVMADKVQGNMGVLVFIILLGMIVYLMNLSGATRRYAQWASRRIKSRKAALFSTMLLGIVVFVDDYFNCLTVGTVMRPLTDRNRISREKLAYVIDSTAAPICIIAPISSWAAAVSSYIPDDSSINGFTLFLRAIVFNYYTWFSLALIVITTLLAADFGKMRRYERQAAAAEAVPETGGEETPESRGRVCDLALPVLALVVFSLICMLYTGGLFSGEAAGIGEAFANCDAITGLAMGGFLTIFFLALLYLPRKIVSGKAFLGGLLEGFKYMVPATLILVLAWTLGGICGADCLDAGGFVSNFVAQNNISLNLTPAVFFLLALVLAFSTGTSWGTFAILVPIAAAVFRDEMTPLMIMATAAILGGGVCGDHLSPISDTTILSSTGADCDHLRHVESQLPYGFLAAAVSVVCYLLSGVAGLSVWLTLPAGIVLLLAFVLGTRVYYAKKQI